MIDDSPRRARSLCGTLGAWSISLALAALAMLPQMARADGCEEVLAALMKNPQGPTHTVVTITVNGASFALDSYSVGGKIYSKRKGVWLVEQSAFDPGKLKKAWEGSTCVEEGIEPLGAEMADVFTEHKSGGFVQSDSKFWVSRISGLMLRSDLAFNGASTMTTTYEYGVQIPPEALAAQPSAATPPK